MLKKLGRLLCIFGLAILLVYAIYKAGFKAITMSGKEENGNLRGVQADDSTLLPKFHLSNVQDSRKWLLRRFCKEEGQLNRRYVGRHMLIDRSSKMLYCVMPKCASRKLRKMLMANKTKEEMAISFFKLFSEQEQNGMLATYFKFTFVREPFERLLSAYKDKFVDIRSEDRYYRILHGREILKNYRLNVSRRSLEEINDIRFSEFMEYLVRKGSNKTTRVMDQHWDNYANVCGMCEIEYDFIGHYETMEQDLADLIKAARMSPQNAKRFSGYKHAPTNTRASLLHYYSQIPLKWIDRLGQIYNDSFKMFGYNFPGPLKSLCENKRVQSPNS